MRTAIALSVFLVAALLIAVGCTNPDDISNLSGLPQTMNTMASSLQSAQLTGAPYLLDTGLTSRSISFENPTGAPGNGGRTASAIGVGRKGDPSRSLPPDSLFTLCDITGSGTIRHIWMTLGPRNPVVLRSLVIRAYWDGQEYPSIECPIGDFMGFAHGVVSSYSSMVHSLGQNAGMNIWLPMPFASAARITITNDGDRPVTIFYQIDYTTGDLHPDNVGRLHCLFHRENPTTMLQDFTILPTRTGKGRYIGAVLGIRYDDPNWWGEGEIKIYMDGDTDYPTICGTGSEDYVCLSYGMQQTPFPYQGCNLNDTDRHLVSMYRWHLPDPIYWEEDCRITIQQIGYNGRLDTKLYERQDDWSTATFWYEAVPDAPLPEMPDVAARTADIPRR